MCQSTTVRLSIHQITVKSTLNITSSKYGCELQHRTVCILTMKNVRLSFTTSYPRSQPLMVCGGVYFLHWHHITAYQYTGIKREFYKLNSCIHFTVHWMPREYNIGPLILSPHEPLP
jgi:hypothetical protein